MGRLLPDTELLARLVAFDSTSRNSNLPIADFLAGYLERPGVRLERNLSPDGTKTNLIAWTGPSAPEDTPAGMRPGLILSGHMDVVPADEEGWRSDPFTLTAAGDRWVGRGACDMKGFLALAANLFSEVEPARLRAPLVLVFTYDEEVGTLGARQLHDSYPGGRALPANAIIGEPTSLRVARLHKGHLKLRVTLKGVSAHSGYPHLGVNAIEPAGRVVEALSGLRRTLEGEKPLYGELFPEVPYVPLNVGIIHGGSAINVVPDRCTVEIGIRPLPGMGSEELADRVRQAVHAAAAPLVPEVLVLCDSPPMLLDPEAPILRHLTGLTGQEGGSVSFATDAGWLSRLGIDCAIWGPGSIEVAHKPNEYVPKAELAAARGMLATTVRRFCGEGS
ncbi:MAG TPA: acetylornithine deacetylase [Thermoanaerobaculia bacterium]|jgi:acetylornithine deacetylase|nr:acetylornithine deacetylase [Thermoanaerobaculia bacterium]